MKGLLNSIKKRSLRVIMYSALVLLPISLEAGEGVWVSGKPAPSKRSEVAVVSVEGKIYVIGGFWKVGVADLVEEYDPLKDSWKDKTPLPEPLHHVGAAAAGGKIYVIGGFKKMFFWPWVPVDTVYEYDPVKDSWSKKASMPTPRGALNLGVVDGKIYAIGGRVKDGDVKANEVYDPESNTWEEKSPLPTARDHHAVAVVEGKIYAIGGRRVTYARNIDANEVYDPEKDVWEKRAPLPTPRSGITASVLDGKIYVFGGEAPEGTFDEVEGYDPKTDSWRTMTPMPTARHGLGSAVMGKSIYVMVGGRTPGGSVSGANEVFTPSR